MSARWVAAYRAQESARADALFNVPYADRLAGERCDGEEFVSQGFLQSSRMELVGEGSGSCPPVLR
jgi:hypothetical protein